MIARTLSWIAEKIGGELVGADLTVSGVSTDTRTLEAGDLYIALVGPNFNGHEFAPFAVKAGASAVIASEPLSLDVPVIVVEDTKLALGALGGAIKAELNPKTVAITGSSGKTTVKEMTAAILRRRGNVLATKGNFNNDIGVPLTLLDLDESHDYAVIELGANHLGEIAYTTQLVKPDIATIVNAAASHLEGFGSLLGVARAKSEIFKGLESSGVAVVNADSQFANFWLGKLRHQNTITFSPDSNTDADYHAQDVTMGLDGCAEFQLHCPIGNVSIQLKVPGLHNVGNALVAASLAIHVGASLQDVQSGLLDMTQVKGRLNVKQLSGQTKLIDDSYNANVASVNAAVDTLSSFSGVRILVLGDMAELGEKARYYHEQVGRYAKDKGVDYVFSLGVLSRQASIVFDQNGFHADDVSALIHDLESVLLNEFRDITILVKGSRSSRMERVVTALEASPLGKLERRRERVAC